MVTRMLEWPRGLGPASAETAAPPTPIYLVAPREPLPDGLPAHAEALVQQTRFKGDLGAVLPLGEAVLVGSGANGEEPFALGAAAPVLGPGAYRLATRLSGEAAYLAHLSFALGAYRFDRYRVAEEAPTLVVPEEIDHARLVAEVEAVTLCRDLVNTPAEEMGPPELAAMAREVAGAFDAQVAVIDGAALEQGFPLIHAVGRAAAKPPCLVDIEWGDPAHPAVTIIGKGVCFDSGGLNIKGGAGMALMKKDMGGAANALALASLIMGADLPVKLRVLIPAVENAISGNAFRPGDVFRARNGLSVEISNTDAEGRLILADALAYAGEAKPSQVISLATLTGAARVALGPDLPPLYSTDEAFAREVIAAGERVNDPVWPMPFWSRYDDYLRSDIADVNHAAKTSFAGSITAALFLKRFVPSAIDYAHFDLFAWTPSSRPGRPVGGEAMAVRAIFEALKQRHSGNVDNST